MAKNHLVGRNTSSSEEVQEVLRVLKDQYGFNQKQLAEAVGVSRVTMSDYYRRRSNPSPLILERLKMVVLACEQNEKKLSKN